MRNRPTIGLLTKSLLEGRSSCWEEMASIAETRDHNLLIFVGGMLKSPLGFEARANILYDFINPTNVDGLIVTGSLGHYIGPQALREFCARFHPLPLVSLEVLLDGFPSIIPDFYAGMRALMKHLIVDHGHRRVAFIRGPADSKTGEDRYHAYLDSLVEYGISPDPRLVAPGTFFPPSGADAVRLLVDQRKATFDALVAANDTMAIDAIEALKERGIRVPESVAVTGFDNLDFTRSVVPPLTTVELPLYDEARLASELLQALLRGEPARERIEIEMKPIIRQSCGCQSLAMTQAEAPIQEDLVVLEATNRREASLQALAGCRKAVIEKMLDACGPSSRLLGLNRIGEIFDAYLEDLTNSAAEERFLPLMKVITGASSPGVIDPSTWQGVLSAHRRLVLPCLKDSVLAQRAENLWQRGRVLLAEMALHLEAQQQHESNQVDAVLRSVGESLLTTFHLADLMDTMERELPRLKIPACYIALYQEKELPADHARLVMAYNRSGRLPLEPGGLTFATREILPRPVLPKDRRATHVIYPLHFHEDRLGYVVFEVGPRNGILYETISLQLSSALKGALLVQEMEERAAELARAKLQAEKADQIKTRLLANVTHELRAPLNAILGYSRMALLEPNPYNFVLPPGLRQDMGNIHNSGEHLIRLINDLLDLSRAEIGELDLLLAPISPRTLLEETFYSFAGTAGSEPNLRWVLNLPARLPVIQADPTRMRQIILNLLSNASKFTETGQIVLGAEVIPPHLHLWVSDTGCGIPIDIQEHIFEPFFTEGYENRRPGGIGLGLTITRRLVALHGGSLSLESQPGKGSTFHIYLPLPNLSGRQLRAETLQGRLRPAMLLISAVEVPIPEIDAMAERSGWEVRRVASTVQLKAALEEIQPATLAWDLAHARPGDWAIVQEVRLHPQLGQIPFILYRKEATGEEGTTRLTNILIKPLSANTLSDLIQSMQPPSAGGSILVVDDDPQARELYFRLISEKLPGYPVILAEDGGVALEWLERETPSLVILDLSMPNVDGFTVLEQLRANPRSRMTPVFVLTGRLLSYEDVKRMDYGQVVVHFKQVLSDEETLEGVQRVFAGTQWVPQPTSLLVKEALIYLQQHYAHTLTRPEIAAAVGVSEDYLSRIFNKEMGLSPWEYLNRYRVMQARLLLEESKESVTWIAAQVGFDDPAYFSRVFQKIEGCSPREYRTRRQSSAAQSA
jgi:signal transduction histidine kinase/DNA-binding LacI/PurR family transcriptional regulator/AraC-like DNA-binding protein